MPVSNNKFKVTLAAGVAAAAMAMAVPGVSIAASTNPCKASVDCAKNPCNPCCVNPCAAKNPCNPCAPKNPCAAN